MVNRRKSIHERIQLLTYTHAYARTYAYMCVCEDACTNCTICTIHPVFLTRRNTIPICS